MGEFLQLDEVSQMTTAPTTGKQVDALTNWKVASESSQVDQLEAEAIVVRETILAEVNSAIITEENVYRQWESEELGNEITGEVARLYKAMRTGEITRDEFRIELADYRTEVQKRVAKHLMGLYLNESGKDGQKIQLLKGLGIVQHDGVDWQAMSANEQSSPEAQACQQSVRSMLEILRSQTQSELPVLTDQSSPEDYQQAFQLLSETFYRLNEIVYVHPDSAVSAEDWRRCKGLVDRLKLSFSSLFRAYAGFTLHMPSNYEAILMHTGLERRLQVTRQELSKAQRTTAAEKTKAEAIGLLYIQGLDRYADPAKERIAD